MFGKLGYQTLNSTKRNLDALGRIVENISNMNSLGYKKTQTSFVETLNGEIARYETKDFSQGPLRRTGEVFDLALNGPGFFEVELPTGQRAYTRAGRFKLNGEGELLTQDGYRVVSQVEQKGIPKMEFTKGQNNEPGLDAGVASGKLSISPELTPEISEDGTVSGINPDSGEKTKIGKISVVVFNNPQGLEPLGKGYFLPTKSSGSLIETEIGPNHSTSVKQGYLEFGNSDIASEFMNLSQMKNILSAHFKVLKVIDKIYEQVHYTISRSA